jgi:hypothetical protein
MCLFPYRDDVILPTSIWGVDRILTFTSCNKGVKVHWTLVKGVKVHKTLVKGVKVHFYSLDFVLLLFQRIYH